MVKRNPCFSKFTHGYLFPEIQKRKKAFLEQNPKVDLIDLSIGDTHYPIAPIVVDTMQAKAESLGTFAGYSGYGASKGEGYLREAIAEHCYRVAIDPEDIFVSDGAKCDVARLATLFGPHKKIAIQNPTYPAYYDCALINHQEPVLMACTPENEFFPDLDELPQVDVIYWCSPNNPTGHVSSKEQLTRLVDYAQKNECIIIFDAAYSRFIQDPQLPQSIFEIEGARSCSIEINSFSKFAGFTGLRLGWSVIPSELKYSDGGSVKEDFARINNTLFNAASNIVQEGGYSALTEEGAWEEKRAMKLYQDNAALLNAALGREGFTLHGGIHAPYIWAQKGADSWALFDEFLNQYGLVTTPGAGFGSAGEGFIRFSALGKLEDTEEACARLKAGGLGKKSSKWQNFLDKIRF